jgi:hypothetical protein
MVSFRAIMLARNLRHRLNHPLYTFAGQAFLLMGAFVYFVKSDLVDALDVSEVTVETLHVR